MQKQALWKNQNNSSNNNNNNNNKISGQEYDAMEAKNRLK